MLMVKLLNYADKARIMKAARLKSPILLDNRKVMFFPDASSELLKHQKAFDPLKKDLAFSSVASLRYGIVHPVQLLITYKGKRHTFEEVSTAERFVRELKSNYNNSG